ncbi:MAG: 1-acyl-sn-glycerol-3-phosphate acyltransferase [Chloroflexi bacterium]|jgi:1-acyl-sn-glycerol-3-phosphate acyltransferase|nr:1-acyl-sn-glycerol-3-phosphate acyltransferase [Chloroflexota bacterium]
MVAATNQWSNSRRRPIRAILRRLARVGLGLLTDLEIVGTENLPERGPLLVVANHFSFIDPVLAVRIAPWPIEFLGGFHMPNAPSAVTFIPKLWGYLPVFRGTGSRGALRAAESILGQGGIVGIFPEGGSWATVLRPARPGTAYLAARTGARILPIGLDGAPHIFPSLRKGRRARVIARIGQPFGPFQASGRGAERRERLEEIGHEIMRHIAQLLPQEQRGFYSDDPAIRQAAKGTEIYPWDEHPET